MSYLPPVVQGLLLFTVLIAAVYDLRWRRIPNWLTLTGVVLGLSLNTLLYEERGLRVAAQGIGLAVLVYLPLYLLRGMGAGDVKLMAAIGAIVGPANWFGIFVLTAVLGGLVAVIVTVTKGRLRSTLWNVTCIVQEVVHLRAPYRKSEELTIDSPDALTLPHGALIALSSIGFLVAAAVWAPR